MAQFVHSFMGSAGFEELKTYTRQSTAFCKELIAVLQERASAELLYAKSLLKSSQRLQKASTNVLLTPLITSWKKVAFEMNNEAEVHRVFAIKLQDECLKPLEVLIEQDSKSKKILESEVENESKVMTDKFNENTKVKRRLHQLSKENEGLVDQINGPRPKTEKDQSKLVAKQAKTEETILQVEKEYYSSLIAHEVSRENWEVATYDACQSMQGMEEERIDHLCRLVCLYNNTISSVTAQLETCSHNIRQITSSLDPEGEASIIAEKKKVTPYVSKQLLCDYYEENLTNRYPTDQRKIVLCRAIEKFLGDIQKTEVHFNGIKNLSNAPANKVTEKSQHDMKNQMTKTSSMIVFLDFNKFKLQKTVALLEGREATTHKLEGSVEKYVDKQGITHSTLKRSLGDIFCANDDIVPFTKQASSISISVDGQSLHEENIDEEEVVAGTLTKKQFQSLASRMLRKSSKKAAPPPPKPPTTSISSKQQCLAKYDYKAMQPDELSFKEGDIITVLNKRNDGWWEGEVSGKTGMFPTNYTDVL